MMDRTFKALADPTRRAILELLHNGDLTAGEIAEQFPVTWASVSHHLHVLRDAELVLVEREGQFLRYSLNTTVLQDVLQHFLNLVPRRRRDRPHG